MKKKIIAIAAVAAILLVSIVGTLAYFKASSNKVTNTFVFKDANINLSITETTGENPTSASDNAGDVTDVTKEYNATLPGQKLAKDPAVVVGNGSVACWVFVKVEELHNTVANTEKKIIQSEVRITGDNAWTKLDNVDNVYYIKVNADVTEGDKTFYVLTGEGEGNLKNGFVTVNPELTTQEWAALMAEGAEKPQLVFTAYAIQLDAATTPAAAWNAFNNGSDTTTP